MKTLAEQLEELYQLTRNVGDAAERVQVLELEVFCQELVDWVRAASTLIAQTAMEQVPHERTKTDPLGFEAMSEVVREGRR